MYTWNLDEMELIYLDLFFTKEMYTKVQENNCKRYFANTQFWTSLE